MDYQVFSDSCCNLPAKMIEEFDIKIFPMVFMVDGKQYQSYLEGQEVDLKQFYDMMREGKVITTSLPNLVEVEERLRSCLEDGKDVLYVGFSSGLSSTFHAIDLLMQNLSKEFPDRKVIAVDTLAASGGEGLLLWHAMQRVRRGESIEKVAEWLEDNKLKCAHWFTVDDLMFLFRGGRVSKTSAWAGTLLKIKPVMHVDDEGHLIPLEKVRGRKKSINAIVDHMARTVDEPASEQRIFVMHGDCPEDANYLVSKIKERFGCNKIDVNYIDPVIGAHSGPGTLAVFYMGAER